MLAVGNGRSATDTVPFLASTDSSAFLIRFSSTHAISSVLMAT